MWKRAKRPRFSNIINQIIWESFIKNKKVDDRKGSATFKTFIFDLGQHNNKNAFVMVTLLKVHLIFSTRLHISVLNGYVNNFQTCLKT